jgi:hypothetical protein
MLGTWYALYRHECRTWWRTKHGARGYRGRDRSGLGELLLLLEVLRSFKSVKTCYKGGIIEIFITKEIAIRHGWGSCTETCENRLCILNVKVKPSPRGGLIEINLSC